MTGKYIACEGVIGTGKTTITNFLSEYLKTNVLYEIVEENPFLEKFYQDPEFWSFQTECFFLCNRYSQLKQVKEDVSSGNTVIGDYHIMKNLIFAELNLKDEELAKYKDLYKTMVSGFDYPDIIVYSDASLEETMRRIRLRDRSIEKNIDEKYIESLVHSYKEKMKIENILKEYPGTQLIKIHSDSVDFFKTPERLHELYKKVSNAIEDPTLIFQELKWK